MGACQNRPAGFIKEPPNGMFRGMRTYQQNTIDSCFFHPDYTVGIGLSPIRPCGSRTRHSTAAHHRRWGLTPRPETDLFYGLYYNTTIGTVSIIFLSPRPIPLRRRWDEDGSPPPAVFWSARLPPRCTAPPPSPWLWRTSAGHPKSPRRWDHKPA